MADIEREKIEFDYSKLRGRIIEKFGTYTAFADEIGLCKQTLSGKLNGDIGVTKEDIINWSGHLGIEKDEIGAIFFALKV